MSRTWCVLLLVTLATLLTGCGAEAWERDPDVQAAKAGCQGSGKELDYACIERHAVESLNPDVCRLAGITIDDMCLQAVYEAADDPAICDRIYLQGVRPNCQAYYTARTVAPTAASSPTPSPVLPASPIPATPPTPAPTATPYLGTDVVISCHEVWPGLPSCGMYHAPLVGGRLAFVDPRPGLDSRPFVVDLENDDVQVLGEQQVSLVSWSPSGEHLLAHRSEHEYVVYSVDGTEYEVSETIGSPPFWAPADALFGATDWLAIPAADGALRAQAFPQGESRNILPAGSLGADGRGQVLWSSEGRLAWSLSMDQVAEAGDLEQVLQVGSADDNREIITCL